MEQLYKLVIFRSGLIFGTTGIPVVGPSMLRLHIFAISATNPVFNKSFHFKTTFKFNMFKTTFFWVIRWSHNAGTIVLKTVKKQFQYSRTCLERPPHLTQKCGLSRQVVSGDRFSYIEM